jgi:hypothetical protein
MTNYYDTYDAAQTVYTFMYNCLFNKGSAECEWFSERPAEGKKLSEDTKILELMIEYAICGARTEVFR